MRIFQFEGYEINAEQIVCVAPVYGDLAWKRFTVTFTTNHAVEFPKGSANETKANLARENFIKAWTTA